MNDDIDLSGRKSLRLFPLPEVVLLPHSILPLHIFEPRYRQMTEDALASDCLVTIVMVQSTNASADGLPSLEEYGCIGRILKHERLEDGRFNMLLVGLRRVRLIRELRTDKLYRIAEAEILEDIEEENDGLLRETLLSSFKTYLGTVGGVDPDLELIISSDLALGILVDILAQSLNLEPAIKQCLLQEIYVLARAETLAKCLREMIERQKSGSVHPRHFQPRFSEN